MAAMPSAVDQRVMIDEIRWLTYLTILEDADTRCSRMTYDQGTLEIMSPSKIHENAKGLIGRLIETFTEIVGIDRCSADSTTFKPKDLE